MWQPDSPTLPQALAAAAVLCCHHHSLLSAAGSPPLGTGFSELLGPQCWLGGSNGRGVGMLGSWTIVDAGNTLSQQSIPTGFPARPQATCRSAAHLPLEWGGPPGSWAAFRKPAGNSASSQNSATYCGRRSALRSICCSVDRTSKKGIQCADIFTNTNTDRPGFTERSYLKASKQKLLII